MKELFNAFMAEFKPWVAAGCPDHAVFHKGSPVCHNFHWYTKQREGRYWARKELFDEHPLPFNRSFEELGAEVRNGTLYKNPKRLAFIQNWEPLK